MRLAVKTVILLALAATLSPNLLNAQSLNCDLECYPSPEAAGYSGVVRARGQMQNVRYRSGAAVPSAAGPAGTTSLPGSSSYSYAIPILHLPGRNGLDLSLTLYHNSAIWNAETDVNGGVITFNADRDFPSYGFRLDSAMSNMTALTTYTS